MLFQYIIAIVFYVKEHQLTLSSWEPPKKKKTLFVSRVLLTVLFLLLHNRHTHTIFSWYGSGNGDVDVPFAKFTALQQQGKKNPNAIIGTTKKTTKKSFHFCQDRVFHFPKRSLLQGCLDPSHPVSTCWRSRKSVFSVSIWLSPALSGALWVLEAQPASRLSWEHLGTLSCFWRGSWSCILYSSSENMTRENWIIYLMGASWHSLALIERSWSWMLWAVLDLNYSSTLHLHYIDDVGRAPI